MPWTLWRLIFNRKTEAESKRDKYYNLYEGLDTESSIINLSLDEANTIHRAYKRNFPSFYTYIPEEELMEAKIALNIRLQREITAYENLQEDVRFARNRAYSKYSYYRDLAASEQQKLNIEDRKIREK